MAPTLLCLHILLVQLTVISLDFAQAGPDAMHNPFSKVKASLGRVLASRVDGGTGLNLTEKSIKWTDWTSGDGTRDGNDADGIWYIKPLIDESTAKYPDPNDRVGIFWAGGSITEDDFDNIGEFNESYTEGKGKVFTDLFDIQLFEKMSLSESNKNNFWWRAINRASKSLAASAYGGTAYVYMNANNCRNLFSPPSQDPQDIDPDHGGQATNGEIWYYAELPTLMRNLNVNKIVTFYKTKREPGKPPKFVQTTQWDVTVNTDKPRDFLPDIAMDAVPIVLPRAADRPPLKRDTLPSDGLSSIGYQKGLSEVRTTSISDLTADSATVYTATSASAVVTTTVPIWSCSSCHTPYNAILISPVSIAGSAGVPSPPPGYKPLNVGPDLKVTPVSLPTASTNSVGPNITNGYGETYRYPRPSMTSQPLRRFPSTPASGASAGHLVPSVSQSSYYPILSSNRSCDTTGGLLGRSMRNFPSSAAGMSTYSSPSSVITAARLGTGSRSALGSSFQKSTVRTSSTRMHLTTTGRASPNKYSSSSSPASQISSSVSLGTSTNSSAIDIGGIQPYTLSMSSRSSDSSFSSTPPISPSSTVLSTSSTKASSTGSSDSKTTPQATFAPDSSIVPTATLARSSASVLSSNLIKIAPIWEDLIDHPTKSKGDNLINKIKGIESLAKEFEHEIGHPPSDDNKDCSVSTNLISDIFNAARCLTDNLDRAETDIKTAIENNFDDLTDLEDELENFQNLERALENDTEKDDEDQSKSASQSNPSSTQSNSPSYSSSCTAIQTASDCSAICSGVMTAEGGSTAHSSQGCSTTCFSIFSACGATNSITTVSTVASGALCPWGGATLIPATPTPAGPFITAWFDYGLSCAGSNCGEFATGSNLSVSTSVGESSSAVATTPPTSNSTSSLASTSLSYSATASIIAGGGGSSPSGTSTQGATRSLILIPSKTITPPESSISPPPPLTTTLATTTMPALLAFTCTSSQANLIDPDYPCVCQGFNYCTQGGGGCGWTTLPAEDCCEDLSATPPMRTSASAHDVQTYRLQEILYSKAIVQALEINALLRMDTHPNPLTLSILVWLYMLLTRVLALSIPNPSLNIDPSNANPLNASDIEIPISNLTSLGGIDPAFDFVPHFQGAKLRPVPCLLNSVNAALQLALENFEGPMFATVFRLASHPQVEIGVLPEEEGGSIPRKYAVWGLNVGIGMMIINHNFQTAIITLSYRGETVARITFKATGAPNSLSTPAMNTTQDLSHPLQNSTTTTLDNLDSNPPNTPHLEISFRLTGSTLTIYEIFLMALDMLRELAPFKLSARLADGVTRVPPANLDVTTRETDPPRTAQNPPYFRVEWLMRAVARTPAYMLEQRSFREVELGLFVDEIKVGEVDIGRPRSGVGLGEVVGDEGSSL